jgi:hypothetical protein
MKIQPKDISSISLRSASPIDIAHFAYLLVKEAGICVRCHQAWARKNRVLCGKCRRYWKQFNKER